MSSISGLVVELLSGVSSLSPDFIGMKDLVVILTQRDSSPDFIGIRMTAKEVILRHWGSE
jgi:hypothetical protein